MAKRTNTATWIDKYSRWQIKVQKDNERKTFYSSTPGRTGQRQANAKADAWLDNNIDNSNIKCSVAINQYLLKVQQNTSLSNYRPKEGFFRNYITPEIGNKKISTITEQNLQNIIDKAYRHKDKYGNPVELSRKTLTVLKADIIAFIKFCRKSNYTKLVPESLTIPAGSRYKGKKILQPDDIAVLFSSDKTLFKGKEAFDDYIYAYRFAVLVGLRPGELRGLKWKDYSKSKGIINISCSINLYNEVTKGKNDNAVRSIKLSQMAIDVLSRQLKHSQSEYIFNVSSTSNYLQRWKKYCKHNNITVTSPYELRHTFVSIAKQLPEGMVKSLVGHSNDMDTFGVYSHELKGDDDKIANQINDIFTKLLKDTAT